MIRITRQTDYGIILLTTFAAASGHQVHTARDVAEAAHLPLPMVSKILKVLAREGLLASQRGVKGGYSLAARPEEITLAQVIRAMEGPIGMTDCTSDPGSCDKEPSCPVRVNWQRISTAVNDALERIPLSDMVGTNAVAPLLEVGSPIPWAVGAGTTGPGRPGMGREPGR